MMNHERFRTMAMMILGDERFYEDEIMRIVKGQGSLDLVVVRKSMVIEGVFVDSQNPVYASRQGKMIIFKKDHEHILPHMWNLISGQSSRIF